MEDAFNYYQECYGDRVLKKYECILYHTCIIPLFNNYKLTFYEAEQISLRMQDILNVYFSFILDHLNFEIALIHGIMGKAKMVR